jgi:hypothetical protein
MKPVKMVKRYLCPVCGDTAESEYEAMNCCLPEGIEAEDWYQCAACGEDYDTREDAAECCKKE